MKLNKISSLILVICSVLILCLSTGALAKHKSAHKVRHHRTAIRKTVIKPNLSMAQNIERIVSKYGDGINVGIAVHSINSNQTIYQRNANRLFVPASVMKTFTAAAALAQLKPTYTFKTTLLAPPKSINSQGVLTGDVYFSFSGDPTLTSDNLNSLVTGLKQLGANTISGNVYLDDTAFDRAEFGPGWMYDERNFCYAAPVGAINIDRNCFPFTVAAAKQTGAPLVITRYKGYDFLNFTNHGITSNESAEDCPLTLDSTEDNKYIVNGCMQPATGPWTFPVAVRSLRPYTAAIIADLLRNNNIHLNGSIKFAPVPTNKNLAEMFENNSEPLSEIIKVMLKKSDNLFANAAYKKVGEAYFNKAGTWSNSAKALASILADSGIDFAKIKIVDGSGLSRHNLLSPQSLADLLNYVYRNEAIRDTFVDALPIAGIDGSLLGRMAEIKNQVRAKTGNMKSTTTLAGYAYTKSGKVLSFAIMINGFVEHVKKYHFLEDEVCAVLVEKG